MDDCVSDIYLTKMAEDPDMMTFVLRALTSDGTGVQAQGLGCY